VQTVRNESRKRGGRGVGWKRRREPGWTQSDKVVKLRGLQMNVA